MNKQLLTENYYGHLVEVTIESTSPANFKVDCIPDSIKEVILTDLLDADLQSGTFDFNSTGNHYPQNENEPWLYVSFLGTWRVLELNHQLLFRIAKWKHWDCTSSTEELFVKNYGESDGKHFYEKWSVTYKYDILQMIGYFGNEIDKGQTFCNIIMEQVEKYESKKLK